VERSFCALERIQGMSWKIWAKRFGKGAAVLAVVGAVSASAYAYTQASAYDASARKVYAIAPVEVARSSDPAVIARGKHLAETLAPCASSHCHGPDLAGGQISDIGPVGTFAAPNITAGGLGAAYSDAELARLVRHGVKKDGRSVVFMPVDGFSWLSDADVAALVSFVRTMPAVDRPNGPVQVKILGKILDRQGKFPLIQAERVDHAVAGRSPTPSPTAEYGAYIGRLCTGCHGPGLSGGPIPGGPPGLPIPKNLTPDATGLAAWSYDDFARALEKGESKDGRKLDPMMPSENLGKMNDTEKHALFAYLRSVQPRPFGNR
jgi:hypothetical protein